MPWVSGPDLNRKTAAVKIVWSIKDKLSGSGILNLAGERLERIWGLPNLPLTVVMSSHATKYKPLLRA